jgi:hypothetical protein
MIGRTDSTEKDAILTIIANLEKESLEIGSCYRD